MTAAAVRVLIVDDHPVVREGVRAMLSRFGDIEVAGEAGTAEEALRLAVRLRPRVALVDLRLPGTSGVELASAMRAQAPEVAVLILSAFRDEIGFVEALAAGARGYVLKDAGSAELHRAILDCAAGGMPVDAGLAPLLVRRGRDVGPLTPRETDVLRLLAQGLANKEIADRLGIAETTVKTHLESIFRKLGAADRAAAVAAGFRRGILRVSEDPG